MNASKLFLTLALGASLALSAQASPPSPPSLGRYNTLWNDSPFTTKPIVVGTEPINPFEDYALGGVTPLSGGAYMVTLLNKKKPEERISIPGNSIGFKVLEVRPGTKGPLSTAVMISNGVKSGLVSFDDKLLVLKAPVAAKGQPGQPGQPLQPGQQNPNGQPMINPNGQPQIQPPVPQPVGQNNNNNQNGGGRPPRPRVVPVPPTR